MKVFGAGVFVVLIAFACAEIDITGPDAGVVTDVTTPHLTGATGSVEKITVTGAASGSGTAKTGGASEVEEVAKVNEPAQKDDDGSHIMLHPKDGTGYNATGEYTGKNSPKTASPSKVCCHICPSRCSEGAGSDCFHKCYKVCGDRCQVEAPENECTLGVDCGMTKKSESDSCSKSTTTEINKDSDKKPDPEWARPPLSADGKEEEVEEEEEEAAPGVTGATAATGVSPEVITDDDIANADSLEVPDAPVLTEPQANDPRDPDYVSQDPSQRDTNVHAAHEAEADKIRSIKSKQEKLMQKVLSSDSPRFRGVSTA